MKRQKAKSHFRSQLLLEVLEQRQLMAVLTSFDRTTKTLTITGTEAADIVSITQNDSTNKLTVVASPSDATTQQFPAHLVNQVIVRLGNGDDQFSYETTGDVWNRKDVQLDFGDGDDTGTFQWADGGRTAHTNLSLLASGADGSDAFGVRIGRVGYASSTTVRVDLGNGDDGFVAETLNPGVARANMTFDVKGGNGDDELQHFSSGALAWLASSTIRLDGQAGNDSVQVSNQGRINGELNETLVGGIGNDSLSSAAVDSDGNGKVTVDVQGSDGDDKLVMDIRPIRNRSFIVRASADGGGGNDVSFTPEFASARNIEAHSLITPQTRPNPIEPFEPTLFTRTLKAQNRTIEYWTKGWSEGTAPVVVLLTDAGDSIDSWLPIANDLNAVGQVIAINKPGYGRTTAVGNTAYNATVIEDIRAVVTRLAPGRQIILVGHSLGGAYANLFARLYPNDVAGLVFADSTAQRRVDPVDIDNKFLTPVVRVYPAGVRAELQSMAESINAPLDSQEFPKIPVIALSQELPEEQLEVVKELADLGYPGTFQVIANAGHYLHADQPQIVIKAIQDMVRKTEISGILADVVAKYGVPGLSTSVILGDRVLTGNAGVRVAGTTAAIQTNDRFGVGSNTKAMTATLAGILVDRGVLRWESTLSQLFPELRTSMRPEYLNVTIEQLLQNRGGIIADEDASDSLAEKVAGYSGPASQSRLALLPEILKEPAPGAVGEFRYSNAGYAVAAAMMERATRIPYESLMQRYIFNPLGMFSATFDPPVSDPTNPRQPMGHLPDGTPAPGDRTPAVYLGVVLRPAGADLRMNVSDWSKFVRIHLGQTVNGVRLVKPQTLTRLQLPVPFADSPIPQGYAMGWGVFESSDVGLDARLGRVLGHLGSDGVWLAEVTAFPDVDFSIQIMANGTVDKDGIDLASGAFNEIKLRLLHRFGSRLL